MENFKEIAEKCLAGELSGTFILRNDETKHVSKKNQTIRKDYLDPYSPYIIGNRKYSRCGVILPISNEENPYDIIDFIPDNMQKQIKIDIPEGKVPVMEQTESGVVITWKDPELTYPQVYLSIYNSGKAISSVSSTVRNSTNTKFLTKINVLRTLINIRNYFGKPDDNENGFYINLLHQAVPNGFPSKYANETVVFAKREHAEQAIKMLGDELKYLFEPW